MVPCDDICGANVLVQNGFWKAIKKIVPEFVQGMTKDEIV